MRCPWSVCPCGCQFHAQPASRRPDTAAGNGGASVQRGGLLAAGAQRRECARVEQSTAEGCVLSKQPHSCWANRSPCDSLRENDWPGVGTRCRRPCMHMPLVDGTPCSLVCNTASRRNAGCPFALLRAMCALHVAWLAGLTGGVIRAVARLQRWRTGRVLCCSAHE